MPGILANVPECECTKYHDLTCAQADVLLLSNCSFGGPRGIGPVKQYAAATIAGDQLITTPNIAEDFRAHSHPARRACTVADFGHGLAPSNFRDSFINSKQMAWN